MMAETLQDRNKRVDANKAWETSLTRRSLIAAFTYIVVGFYLMFLDITHPWLHALVPSMAYVVSTLTLPLAKTIWIEKIYKQKD